ncbi:MAG: NADH-quinone oxidoreductase subunit J [Alphaproteobacteria bacterium]
MILSDTIFYFFAVLLIFFAILAVSSKNKISGLLFLVPFICTLSGILIALGFEFVALSLGLIDLSSICVVTVFAIMIEENNSYDSKNIKNLFAFFMFSLFLVFLINVVAAFFGVSNVKEIAVNNDIFSFKELGRHLFYSRYFLFQISGVILFCGASGAIMLVYGIEGKEQEKIKKSKIHKDEDLELVKLAPEKEGAKI